MEPFAQLLSLRWGEAQQRLGIPGRIRLSWEVTPDYEHFHTPRGFGVTFYNGEPACHLAFAPKLLSSPVTRQDGIIRHELGHVLDLCVRKRDLNAWAEAQGVFLPRTPERRADAIAEAIWGEPILYDRDLVQSTTRGRAPRPAHLGL